MRLAAHLKEGGYEQIPCSYIHLILIFSLALMLIFSSLSLFS